MIPAAFSGDYTITARMRRGKKIIVHGDGQSLWTFTHNTDFAKGLVGLLGNAKAVGEAFHITSDEALTWDQIYMTIGRAAGVEPALVHIPSEFIDALDAGMGSNLLGDMAYSMVMDNSKVKSFVPDFEATVSLAEGVRRSMEWFQADESRMAVNRQIDETMDRIISAYEKAWPD